MNWRDALATERPLLLPCAHDALSARIIQEAGFSAYSIGGFPLVGARHALPDVGLVGLGEMAAGIRDILAASTLPVLVDADDGYGDVKNVTRTVRLYESMGVAAMFIEDQVSPKRCGHMAGKDVVAVEVMETKVRAAVAARRDPDTFIMARTDARAVHGLDDALRRAERYLEAGADGIFVEAPRSPEELEQVAKSFDVPQLANMRCAPPWKECARAISPTLSRWWASTSSRALSAWTSGPPWRNATRREQFAIRLATIHHDQWHTYTHNRAR
jgi:2-methylisocitrate lyase-like PEP mutase family enzyme